MIRPPRPVPDRKRLDEELRLSCPSTPERQRPGRPARLGTPEGAANQPTQRSCLSSAPPYYVPVRYVSLRALQKGFHGASAPRPAVPNLQLARCRICNVSRGRVRDGDSTNHEYAAVGISQAAGRSGGVSA